MDISIEPATDSQLFDIDQRVHAGTATADDARVLLATVYGRVPESAVWEAEETVRETLGVEIDALEKERDQLQAAVNADALQLTREMEQLRTELREARYEAAELRRAKPYRYVRVYRVKAGTRWALWERVQGERAKRVGTAHTEDEYRRFLKGA